jgi:thioesterase domain-containing protein
MMRQRGAEVEVVLLLDTWLPQGFRRNWLKWAGIQLGNLARGNLGPLRRKLSRLRDRLSGRGATQGVTAKTVYEAFELRQAAFRQAMAAWDTQRLILDFDVVLFRVSVHDWGEHVEFDEDYGWRSYLSRPPRVVRVGGDHMSLIAPPHVADLGKIARQSLR